MEHGEPTNQALATLPDGKWNSTLTSGWSYLPDPFLLSDQLSGVGIEIIPEEKIEKGGIINHTLLLPEQGDDGYTHYHHDLRGKDGNVCAW